MELVIAQGTRTITGPRDPANVLVVGKSGIPGADGNLIYTHTAGQVLSGHRVVRIDAATGKAVYADNSVLADAGALLGVTLGAAVLNASVRVQAFGELTEATWTWTPGAALYLGTAGQLTETPPELPAVFSECVAFALTATTILIDTEIPIIL